jgi:predicted nucleic acid-binding protein
VILVDASVMVDLLLGLPPHDAAIARLLQVEAPHVFAPHLLEAEVAQVMRKRVRFGSLKAVDARASRVSSRPCPSSANRTCRSSSAPSPSATT